MVFSPPKRGEKCHKKPLQKNTATKSEKPILLQDSRPTPRRERRPRQHRHPPPQSINIFCKGLIIPENGAKSPDFGAMPENAHKSTPPTGNARKTGKNAPFPPPSEPPPPPAAVGVSNNERTTRKRPRRLYRSPSEVRETHKKPPPPQRNTPNGILTKKIEKSLQKICTIQTNFPPLQRHKVRIEGRIFNTVAPRGVAVIATPSTLQE